MHANKQNSIPQLHCGDIAAVVGFKDIKTGDTLSDEKNKIVLESMDFPDPVIGYAIEPKTQADVDKLGMAIAKLVEEDPTLTVNTDEETGQTILRGMGELHLDIIMDRLKREFKVECNQGAPQVAYKEAITRPVDHREVYKKQFWHHRANTMVKTLLQMLHFMIILLPPPPLVAIIMTMTTL